MHIHWFSPLPPAHSDVAWFSLRVVPQLLATHKVTLWVDEAHAATPAPAAAELRVFRASQGTWRELNLADAVVFNLGNHSRFHEWIWRVSRVVPGIVIVHDPALQHFIYNLGRTEHERAMRRYYG